MTELHDEAAEGEAAQVSLREGLKRARGLVNKARHQIADRVPAAEPGPDPEPEPEPAPPNPAS